MKKQTQITLLYVCCIAAMAQFGCEDSSSGQDLRCDCATGEHCTDDEKKACETPKCDCATGEHCSDDEKKACELPKCDCATGANCSDDEKKACETAKCDCATGANCSDDEKKACESSKCDCATGANCTDDEKNACNDAQAACEKTGCPEGEKCVDGICTDLRCADKQCPEMTQCRAGECIEIACLGMTCDDGKICQKGSCVSAKCKGIECGEGSTCNDEGKCESLLMPEIHIWTRNERIMLDDGSEAVVTHEKAESEVAFDIAMSGLQPNQNVTFTMTTSDSDEIKIKTGKVVITPEKWLTTQTLTANCVHDERVDGDKEVTLTIKAVSDDPKFNGFEKKFTVINRDSDVASVIVTPPEDPTIYEGNYCKAWRDLGTPIEQGEAEIAFKLRLTSKPNKRVFLSVESNGNYLCLNKGADDAELNDHSFCSAACTTMKGIFFEDPDKIRDDYEVPWNEDVTVTIADYDGGWINAAEFSDITFKLQQFCDETEDCEYDGLAVDPLRIRVVDNDIPSLVTDVTQVTTYDDGSEVKVCAHLSSRSKDTVMVTMTVDNPDVIVDTAEPQTVTHDRVVPTCFKLHGATDGVIDEDKAYQVTLTPTVNGVVSTEIPTLVLDAVNKNTEQAGVRFTRNGLVLQENHASWTRAVLYNKPRAAVKLKPILPDDIKDIYTVDKMEYTIEADKWQEGVKIDLTTLENNSVSVNSWYSLTFKTESADPNYDGLKVSMDFKIRDENTWSVNGELALGGPLLESQDREWFKYNVKLGFDPNPSYKTNMEFWSSDVSELKIRPNPKDPRCTVSTTDENHLYCTFGPNEWRTGLSFEVSPVDDKVRDGDQNVYINNELYKRIDDHSRWVVPMEPMGPIVVKDIYSSIVNIYCDKEVLDCGQNTCHISLMQNTEKPVDVEVALRLYQRNSVITPSKFTFNGKNNLMAQSFTVQLYNPSMTGLYVEDVFKVKTSGEGEYDNYQYMQRVAFFPYCETLYDSRTTMKDRDEGMTLPAGSYRLEVVGAGGGNSDHLNDKGEVVKSTLRGDGAPGSYSTGVLTLKEPTTVYMITGYGGMDHFKRSDYCNRNLYNCGGRGTYGDRAFSFGSDGGGASDIRIGTDDIHHRVIVAAGGDGDGNPRNSTINNLAPVLKYEVSPKAKPAQAICEGRGHGNSGHLNVQPTLSITGSGGGGGGWFGGAYGHIAGMAGRGACGGIFREGWDGDSENKLDPKYWLTDYGAYDELGTGDIKDEPELFQEWKAAVAEGKPGDGIVRIKVMPKK